MRYEKIIMKHIPNTGFIYADDLFSRTSLKKRSKFDYTLQLLHNNGFISVGNCNDIILISREAFADYAHKKRIEAFRFWFPTVVAIISLIVSILK